MQVFGQYDLGDWILHISINVYNMDDYGGKGLRNGMAICNCFIDMDYRYY